MENNEVDEKEYFEELYEFTLNSIKEDFERIISNKIIYCRRSTCL